MGTRVRSGRPWTAIVLAALVLVLDLAVAPAAHAAAGDSPQYCTLDLTTHDWSCTTSPATAARMVRPAAEGAGSILLGRFYDETNLDGSGAYFNVTAASGCDANADLDYSVGSMPSGWNDRVSSFQGYNGCQVKLWQNGGFGGASYGPVSYAYTVGPLDNQASSITFY